jgi:hypothetical protein
MAAPLSQDPEAGDLTVVNEILDIVYKDVDVPGPDSKPVRCKPDLMEFTFWTFANCWH